MKPSLEDLKNELKRQKIGLSFQRLKVLAYLSQHLDHPTVDQIYSSLIAEVPSLSKTTVYNTLRVLQDAGLVRPIHFDDYETRFDVEVELHGHFKCDTCGTIYNFPLNPILLNDISLPDFQISDRTVYFKGICPTCLSNKKQTRNEEA